MLLIAAALAIGAPAAGCGGYETRPAAATSAKTIVEMTDSSFAPKALTVKVGDTVTFVDRDEIAHTATAEGAFDTGTLRQGASFHFRATKPGTVDYVCAFHPGMTGKLVVT
jgi:plastocyanin